MKKKDQIRDMRLKIPTRLIDIIPVNILAFLCAIVLILTRNLTENGTVNQWLLKKQTAAISCDKTASTEPGSSGDKSNDRGCAHQLGTSCLFTIDGDKKNKTHTC